MKEVLMENCSSGSFRQTHNVNHMGIIQTLWSHCDCIIASQLSIILDNRREDNRDALQDEEKMDNLGKWIMLGTAEQTHSSASIINSLGLR